MIGVELDRPCGELVKTGLDAGLVFNVTADNVIRLLPALVISEAEGREVVERLVPLVKAFLAQGAAQPQNCRGALRPSWPRARSRRCGITSSSATCRAPSTSTCSRARAGSRTASSATSATGRSKTARWR